LDIKKNYKDPLTNEPSIPESYHNIEDRKKELDIDFLISFVLKDPALSVKLTLYYLSLLRLEEAPHRVIISFAVGHRFAKLPRLLLKSNE